MKSTDDTPFWRIVLVIPLCAFVIPLILLMQLIMQEEYYIGTVGSTDINEGKK